MSAILLKVSIPHPDECVCFVPKAITRRPWGAAPYGMLQP
jgi:hypothetical protein